MIFVSRSFASLISVVVIRPVMEMMHMATAIVSSRLALQSVMFFTLLELSNVVTNTPSFDDSTASSPDRYSSAERLTVPFTCEFRCKRV